MQTHTFCRSARRERDRRPVQTVGICWQIRHARKSALVPVDGTTRHLMDAVVVAAVRVVQLHTDVEHVTVERVRLPDLTLREVTAVAVDGISWRRPAVLYKVNMDRGQYLTRFNKIAIPGKMHVDKETIWPPCRP